MTKEEFDKIREFALHLSILRIQVPDGQLLDQCQQALHDLCEKVEEIFASADAQKEWQQPGEVEFLEAPPPEDVKPPPGHLHEESLAPLRSNIVPGSERDIPPQFPKPVEPRRVVAHKASHKKTPHKR